MGAASMNLVPTHRPGHITHAPTVQDTQAIRPLRESALLEGQDGLAKGAAGLQEYPFVCRVTGV
jgi:hypothetical protein